MRNVLSLSTAGKNRYLLHFNSSGLLTQWTAAIRLAIYENTQLHESYTGALIAGKGRALNGIGEILNHKNLKVEQWTRVRFKPGTPWKRCWCVINPPEAKASEKIRRSIYERPDAPKGNIKFYENKKTKRAQPIATITNVYSAFAVYPQSHALVEHSPLIKLEGTIQMHTRPETISEGLIFVLPDVRPAISGFEIMLRWLFPVFDAFGLYGRPTRLLADTTTTRSLMFALPLNKRRGYLDILDVINLIHTDGSHSWSESLWRKQLKEATSHRMTQVSLSRQSSVATNRPQRSNLPARAMRFPLPARSNGALGNCSSESVPKQPHRRVVSDTLGLGPRYSAERNFPITSPPSLHRSIPHVDQTESALISHDVSPVDQVSDMNGSSDIIPHSQPENSGLEYSVSLSLPPEPVSSPPPLFHSSRDTPTEKPSMSIEQGERASSPSKSTLSRSTQHDFQSSLATAITYVPWTHEQEQRENGDDHSSVSSFDFARKEGPVIDTHAVSEKPRSIQLADSPIHDSIDFAATMFSSEPENRSPTGSRSSRHFGETFPSLDTATSCPPASPQSDSPLQHSASQPQPISTPKSSMDRQASPHRETVINSNPEKLESEDANLYHSSSLDSLRNFIDISAINTIVARTPSPTQTNAHLLPRIVSKENSSPQIEERDMRPESPSTEDYESTKRSSSVRSNTSVPRRMGIKKTVGGDDDDTKDVVIGDAHYQNSTALPPPTITDIPTVDFGPTHVLDPVTTRRPLSAELLADRNPLEKKTLHKSSRSTSFNHIFSEPIEHTGRNDDGKRRSTLWQPGMAVPPGSSSPGLGPKLAPDQFVQQVAVAANTPTYRPIPKARPISNDRTSHTRRSSGHTLGGTSSRPHSRSPSAMLRFQNDGSPSSLRGTGTMLNVSGDISRPNSRNTGSMVNDITMRLNSLGTNNTAPHDPLRPRSRGTILNDVPPRSHSRGATASINDSPSRPGSRAALNDYSTRPHSRGPSVTLGGYDRPHSRGASMTLSGSPSVGNQLSAREQEAVSRITGSSFFNVTSDNIKPQRVPEPDGLVNAIAEREREKRMIMDNANNTIAQAIAQRQPSFAMSSPNLHASCGANPLSGGYATSGVNPSPGPYTAPGAYPSPGGYASSVTFPSSTPYAMLGGSPSPGIYGSQSQYSPSTRQFPSQPQNYYFEPVQYPYVSPILTQPSAQHNRSARSLGGIPHPSTNRSRSNSSSGAFGFSSQLMQSTQPGPVTLGVNQGRPNPYYQGP